MYCLTQEQIRKELDFPGSPISFDEKFYPFFTDPEADCFSFDIPSQGLTLPSFARGLSLLEAEEETYFHGAFLWYALWNIGSPQLDKIGWAVVEKMRLAYGETRPLEMASAHRFREDELVQLQAFLLQGLSFQWDVNLVHNTLDRFVHASHDGYIVVAAKTGEALEQSRALLESRNPKPASDQIRSLFLRPHVSVRRK